MQRGEKMIKETHQCITAIFQMMVQKIHGSQQVRLAAQGSASYNCINITLSGVSALANENKTYNPTGSKHTGWDKEDSKPLYSTTTETSQDTYPPQLGSAPSYKNACKQHQTRPHFHSQPTKGEKKKRKCRRTWKSFTFPPPDLLKARTHNSTKKKEEKPTKTLKNNAPAKVCSAVQQQTTPAMNTKHHRISFATKK
jgi:hypothetical protein